MEGGRRKLSRRRRRAVLRVRRERHCEGLIIDDGQGLTEENWPAAIVTVARASPVLVFA